MMNMNLAQLATLSRLTISPAQKEKFEADLAQMIAMVEHLPDLEDTGSLLDPTHPMELRPDTATQTFTREELLQNAPAVKAGCVLVPKVVE